MVCYYYLYSYYMLQGSNIDVVVFIIFVFLIFLRVYEWLQVLLSQWLVTFCQQRLIKMLCIKILEDPYSRFWAKRVYISRSAFDHS